MYKVGTEVGAVQRVCGNPSWDVGRHFAEVKRRADIWRDVLETLRSETRNNYENKIHDDLDVPEHWALRTEHSEHWIKRTLSTWALSTLLRVYFGFWKSIGIYIFSWRKWLFCTTFPTRVAKNITRYYITIYIAKQTCIHCIAEVQHAIVYVEF